ncbi:acyltransferase family protein [Mucilaginibacter psychrotolerans]|uniref:Acyltransferase n=1 Tax=Mucilaginibacter psychrotolerans TaxID=1524096 RepID=A0A4Y8SPR8_9SPHI|nr:acyltransferase [Mucilaginibacter psychrotolerans]TFF40660.1 acyltransferase [Mucilaginibacter psychrotolerans]
MPGTHSANTPEQSKGKILYIDHLKVVLTVLVILHHACVTYGAPGGWYYSEKTTLMGALLPMTVFVAVNQAFFMGFFFFLSALFIPSSFDKKGPAKFLVDKLIRLGLPLVFYALVLSPFLSFMVYNYTGTHPQITYAQYLSGFDGWINFGVLWFVAALLIFTLAYALFRMFMDDRHMSKPLPSVAKLLLFAGVIGLISYAVRIVFPVGWVLKPLGFQLGHFPQYIAMFILGLIASRSKWIANADYQTGKTMRTIALRLVYIGFPAFFVAQKMLDFPTDAFNIGGHWQSLWYAVWEQLVGFSIVTALLCIGKERWNKPSQFLSLLSRSTFAVYIFHPLILIALSVALHNWVVEPALKLLVVARLAVIGSFLLGLLVVRIPWVNRVV